MSNCFLYNECNHIDCDKDVCVRKFKLSYLYDNALITETQRKHIILYAEENGTDVKEFNELKHIEDNIVEFVENGNNLYISSNITGNGKTSWSLRLVQAYFNKIWAKTSLKCRALFINVPRYLLEIKSNISNKSEYITYINDNILNADIVIWDDIGTKGLTSFEHENVLSLINSRINLGKSNIYSSNLDDNELREVVGDRLYSRIINMSKIIKLNGKDKRRLTNDTTTIFK